MVPNPSRTTHKRLPID
uniref:Uncharacterized protein n=1 Tax=Arundo donax TaxID=35708 RepID=A0A0A9BAA5_ARUDO